MRPNVTNSKALSTAIASTSFCSDQVSWNHVSGLLGCRREWMLLMVQFTICEYSKCLTCSITIPKWLKPQKTAAMWFLELDTKGRSTTGHVHPASSPSIQKVFPWRKGSRETRFKVRFCTVGESTEVASGSERVGVKWWHPSSKGKGQREQKHEEQ